MSPTRIIDLHTDWLLQYAGETTVYAPALYPGVASRLGQAAGYLQSTSAAIVSCFRRAADWSAQADPWAALDALITRIEAEFPGRVLRDPIDLDRWRDDPDGLAWAMIGVEGFDPLIRAEADLDRLPGLLRRGVRLFQPTYTAGSVLAGSSVPGDDRGLLDLGRRFLERLAEISEPDRGPLPIVDLAHLNPTAAADVLSWFLSDPDRPRRLIPVYSHGALRHNGFSAPRAITLDNLARLRSLGGVIGFGVSPPFYSHPDQIQAGIEAASALPFLGRPGFEGIAIGTDFLGVDATLPTLANAEAVATWVEASFPAEASRAILVENGRRLIARSISGTDPR
jgi:membrane dipeptidase